MTKPYWAMDEYERRQFFTRVKEGLRLSLAGMGRAADAQAKALRQLGDATAKLREREERDG